MIILVIINYKILLFAKGEFDLYMETSYTIFNKNNAQKYSSTDNIEETVNFLKNPKSFRNFDEGLRQILIEKGFADIKDNNEKLANQLWNRLNEIGSTIQFNTVRSWFCDNPKPRPKVEAGSRRTIYEICFVLNLSLDETECFF